MNKNCKTSKKYKIAKAQTGLVDNIIDRRTEAEKLAWQTNPLVPPFGANTYTDKTITDNAGNTFYKTDPNQRTEASISPVLTDPKPEKSKFNFFDTTKTTLHPAVGLANYLALGATAIGAKVNDAKTDRDEAEQYRKALQPVAYKNMERYGLNGLPVFTKFGGKVGKYNFGGLTPEQILGTAKPKGQLMAMVNQFGGEAQNLIEAESGEVVQGLDGEVREIPDSAPTHEEGGIIIPDAHAVLENTSHLRGDNKSKVLKVDPTKFKLLTGLDTKKSMSHAKALVEADDVYEKQRTKIVKKIDLASKDKKSLDKYAETSIKLNMDTLQSLPTRDQLFENLLTHQEAVKEAAGIETGDTSKFGGKFKFGGKVPKAQFGEEFIAKQKQRSLNPYGGSKTGGKTPAGNSDAFPKDMKFEDFLKDLADRGFKYEGINDNKALQTALYNYKLQKGELDDIREMWKEGMHKQGMSAARAKGFVDEKGMFLPGVLESETHLKELGEMYPDGLLGARLLKLAGNKKTIPPRIWEDGEDLTPDPLEEVKNPDPSITNTFKFINQPKSKFHEPLRWFDVASPLGAYTSALERIPEKYNPAEFNQLRYKLEDPTAQLQQNQADFNSTVDAVGALPLGAGSLAANIAGATGSKYLANTQVLGGTENRNAATKNREIEYNTQVRDKNSVATQQAREIFDTKVLKSKAIQQEQKLTALDSLYKTFAENNALNRNGNLVMKFSKAFDQYGDYNGYQHVFGVSPQFGMPNTGSAYTVNQPKGKTESAGGVQGLTQGKTYYNRKTGKTLFFDGNNLVER
jgi:hypothetical protein